MYYSTQEPETDLKIVVLGTSGVGKSALGTFVDSYDPTLEDTFRKTIQVSEEYKVDVEILDTAGTDQIAAMRDMYIHSGDIFMIIYAVDSRASFNEAIGLFDRIQRIRSKKCPVILVANKKDLPATHRRITYEQGAYLAHQRHCGYIETSARCNDNVEEAFLAVINMYINHNPHIFLRMNRRENLGSHKDKKKSSQQNGINEKILKSSVIANEPFKKKSKRRGCIIC